MKVSLYSSVLLSLLPVVLGLPKPLPCGSENPLAERAPCLQRRAAADDDDKESSSDDDAGDGDSAGLFDENGKPNAGMIAGLAAGIILVVLILIGVGYFYCKKKKKEKNAEAMEGSDAEFGTGKEQQYEETGEHVYPGGRPEYARDERREEYERSRRQYDEYGRAYRQDDRYPRDREHRPSRREDERYHRQYREDQYRQGGGEKYDRRHYQSQQYGRDDRGRGYDGYNR
ncbi:hypothetical protein COEREDRAFT_11682 [Coemansia reversa NRRL 1564]|uniref:Mid2 domain-containing protein n=1 Tax=Coemansia reversa (strain ATCC 12441 / NRRL 1564) TaxID=763665 RepID=A0A2G5B2F1_COERN|nr:hypothetical protein COEREDRAFT_11682 [Coemansia reversa NRRL 1564]|eukprot:PIA13186.1 hypothetical protein COEREDRAFT_11682 [Coemansia reversa NRRL 1564]